MDHDLGLGKIIEGERQRDAIHVAIAPVIAKTTLYAGQHAGLGGTAENPIGIVDPFLRQPVFPEQRFWLFLYPNTITSLRHDWTHPAFAGSLAPEPLDDVAAKAASEEWLREFVRNSDCPDYHTLIAAAVNGTNAWDDNYIRFSDEDAHGDIPDEFWEHVERVTGQKITLRPKHFSCSC